MTAPTKPAPPGEVHPFYQSKRYVIDWVNGMGPYARRLELKVADTPPVKLSFDDVPGVLVSEMLDQRVFTLRLWRAVAPAPYVGEEFFYQWHVAVDDLGRQVAGESRRLFTDPVLNWMERTRPWPTSKT